MTDIEKKPQKEIPDLYKRSIKGGFWVFALQFSTQVMQLVKSIIVFNFLFNENLELIIVANMLMAVLKTFSESGFHAALIQKKENIESYLDTAWVIGILRGIILFTAMFFLAPLLVSFRVEPEKTELAIRVIRVLGLTFLISAFQNIGTVYFKKEMQFHKTFWLKMAAAITDITLSITLVLIYRSVWGYVIARLASTSVAFVLGYLLCPYRPKFHFIPEKAKKLWTFGRWVLGANIIGYLLDEGDDWFVWFFFPSPTPFKLYRYAYNFSNLPETHLNNIIDQISFPAYSKIQHDLPRLREAYKKILQATATVSIPVAFLIFSLGPDFIQLFLIEKSHDMIPIVQILALLGLIQSLGPGALFRSTGNPHFMLYSQGTRLLLLTIIIYPFTYYWGIIGTAFSVVTVRVLVFPVIFFISCKVVQCRAWTLAKPLCFSFLAAIIMTATIMFLKIVVINSVTIPLFFILACTAAIVYLSTLFILDTLFHLGYRDILSEHANLITQRFPQLSRRGDK